MKAIRRYLKYFVIQITKTNLKLSYSSENPQNIMHIFKILLKPCVMFLLPMPRRKTVKTRTPIPFIAIELVQ